MSKWIFISCVFLFSSFGFSQTAEPLGDGIFIWRYSQESSSQPRIAIVTIILDEAKAFELWHHGAASKNSYAECVDFGTRSKHLYAQKHGYDLVIGMEKINHAFGSMARRPLEASWTKLPLVSRFLGDYDWVFWTDADSVILNFDIKLESFLDENYDVIACSEKPSITKPTCYCKEIDFINCGQVFYKNSSVAKEVLSKSWLDHFRAVSGIYEQESMNNFIVKNNYQNFVKVHPRHDFNICPQAYEEGDFLVHMFGLHGDDLLKVFREYEARYSHVLDYQDMLLNH